MADDILKGASDMHCHAGPSVMVRDLDYVAAAQEAEEAGMRAIVVKDHLAPSAMTIAILESRKTEMFSGKPPKVEIFGSICLNHHVGGLNPYALEIALERGAKVVWLPTVSAEPHIRHAAEAPQSTGPFAVVFGKLRKQEPIPVVDDSGKVVPELHDIFDIIKKYDVVMATGHIGPRQILGVLPAAREAGLQKIVVTHPTIGYFGTTPEQVREMVGPNTVLEHEIGFWNPARKTAQPISGLIDLIREHGPEHTILSSDLGQLGNTHPVAGLTAVAHLLLDNGLTQNELDTVMKKNQAGLLGLD